MTDANQGTAPVADGAPAPHASDNIPVQTGSPEPLIVANDAPDPVVDPVVDPAAAADPAGDPAEPGKKPAKLPEWAEKKIASEAFARREAERKVKDMAAELAAFKAAKPEPVAPVAPTADDAAAATAAAPAGGYKSQAEFDQAVQQETDKRAASERAQQAEADFTSRCNVAYSKGKETFSADFDTAVANLQNVGAMGRELLDLVLETDDPSKVLYELGSDPDKAASILEMTPAKRALEIAKLAVTPSAKKPPTPISNAPAPVVPVEGTARITAEPDDKDEDAAWFAKRNAQLAAKRQQMGA